MQRRSSSTVRAARRLSANLGRVRRDMYFFVFYLLIFWPKKLLLSKITWEGTHKSVFRHLRRVIPKKFKDKKIQIKHIIRTLRLGLSLGLGLVGLD